MKYVTQWFHDEKPMRKGVYERRTPFVGEKSYSYWDGKFWHMSAENASQALRLGKKRSVSNFQNASWRGLCK